MDSECVSECDCEDADPGCPAQVAAGELDCDADDERARTFCRKSSGLCDGALPGSDTVTCELLHQSPPCEEGEPECDPECDCEDADPGCPGKVESGEFDCDADDLQARTFCRRSCGLCDGAGDDVCLRAARHLDCGRALPMPWKSIHVLSIDYCGCENRTSKRRL